jgi:hypothetical protein
MRNGLVFGLLCSVATMCALAAPGPSAGQTPVIEGPEMIFWEHQDWGVGGGRERLVIWADGRNEAQVVLGGMMYTGRTIVARPGWTMVSDSPHRRFVRTDVLTRAEARRRFACALEEEIQRLETFAPSYLDGRGTLVGVQIDTDLVETTMPVFMPGQRGTPNHQRFEAVSACIGEFDTSAFDVKR